MTLKEVIESHIGPIQDEEVIHVLVDLRRKIKRDISHPLIEKIRKWQDENHQKVL